MEGIKLPSMNDTKNPCNCTFDWSEDGEVLNITTKLPKGSWPYPIELERIPTPLALVGWLHHLLEKNWFNQWDAREMIDVVCTKKDWDQHQGW